MHHYIIQTHAQMAAGNGEGERVSAADVGSRVDELSGRGCLSDGRGFSAYIIAACRRSADGKTYVACARGSEGAAAYGRGFILQRVGE